MLAAAVKDDKENSERAFQEDIIVLIADIFNETSTDQNIYIYLLNIVKDISMNSSEAADKFIENYIQMNLMKEIKPIYSIYKRNNDLSEGKEAENNE